MTGFPLPRIRIYKCCPTRYCLQGRLDDEVGVAHYSVMSIKPLNKCVKNITKLTEKYNVV